MCADDLRSGRPGIGLPAEHVAGPATVSGVARTDDLTSAIGADAQGRGNDTIVVVGHGGQQWPWRRQR